MVLAREEEFVVCFVQAEEAVDCGDEQCEVANDDGDCGLNEGLVEKLAGENDVAIFTSTLAVTASSRPLGPSTNTLQYPRV